MADIAAGKTFQFELVSPEKVLVSEQVALVEIPGETGNFGVLADHAPLLSSIRPGIVTVTGADGVVKKIFVAGGLAAGHISHTVKDNKKNDNDADTDPHIA